jgi:hypothetical protein
MTVNLKNSQEECISYLGEVGALLFFAYASLRSEASVQNLLDWTGILQDAVFGQKEKFRYVRKNRAGKPRSKQKLMIKKPQISKWKKANYLLPPVYAQIDGLDFRLLNLEIHASNNVKKAWVGNLILIYEAKTDSLFHHSITVTESSKVTGDLILYVIGKSVEAVKNQVNGSYLLNTKITFSIPCMAKEKADLAQAYVDAINTINQNAQNHNPVDCTWLQHHTVQVIFYDWQVQLTNLQQINQIFTNINTAWDFCNALTRISNKMCTIAKKRREQEILALEVSQNDKEKRKLDKVKEDISHCEKTYQQLKKMSVFLPSAIKKIEKKRCSAEKKLNKINEQAAVKLTEKMEKLNAIPIPSCIGFNRLRAAEKKDRDRYDLIKPLV